MAQRVTVEHRRWFDRSIASDVLLVFALFWLLYPLPHALLEIIPGVSVLAVGSPVIAGLLTGSSRRLTVLLAGLLIAGNVWSVHAAGWSPGAGAVRVIIDCAAFLAVPAVIRRWKGQPRGSLIDVGRSAMVAATPAIARTVSMALAMGIDGRSLEHRFALPAMSGLAAFAGSAVFIPIGVIWMLRHEEVAGAWRPRRPLLAIGVAALLALASSFTLPAASAPHSAHYLVLPVFAYAAFVLHPFANYALVAMVAPLVALATVMGRGPFGYAHAAMVAGDPDALTAVLMSAIDATGFIASMSVTVWFMTAAVRSTQREALEAEATRRRLAAVVEQSAVPMQFTALGEDNQWAMGTFNDAMADFYGYAPDVLRRMNWDDLTHPDDLPRALTLHEDFMAGRIDDYTVTLRFLHRTGAVRTGILHVVGVRDLPGVPLFVIAQISDITETMATREALQQLVDFDPFTGMYSRPWMTEELDRRLRAIGPADPQLGVLVVDVTAFHVVRKTYGYLAGDEVLQALAMRVRAAASAWPAITGRFDGERFIVLVPSVVDGMELSELARRICDAVGDELLIRGTSVIRPATIGIAVSHPGSTVESLILAAEGAVAAAEAEGDTRWVFADHASGAAGGHFLEIEDDIRGGIERDEFRAYFQPQVDIASGRTIGYEALVRWHHPQRGVLSPAAFIAIAEDSGLIRGIGRSVLRQACQALADHPTCGTISVNVSALQFRDPDWLAFVRATLLETAAPGERLVLELTETVALKLDLASRERLHELRALGLGLHLDDFGTGYSSVAVLNELPVTGIKLDRSFVTDISTGDAGLLALVRGLGALAQGLGLETVAEGIESAEAAAAVHACGWQAGQGYLYGRPTATLERLPQD